MLMGYSISRHSSPAFPSGGVSRFVSKGLLLLALCISVPVQAGLFQLDGELAAFGFNDVEGAPPQTPPTAIGEALFSFQYDDSGLAGVGVESLDMLSLLSFQSTIDGVAYTAADVQTTLFFLNGALIDFIIFAGGTPALAPGTNDLQISMVGFNPGFVSGFEYTSANYASSRFVASTFEGEVRRTAVPLPASLSLMLVALGALRVLN